jgi:SAM-dependent methyltransferase
MTHNGASRILGKFVSLPGITYVLTRFGGTGLRDYAMSQNYVSGRWQFQNGNMVPDMVALVEKHAKQGAILEMGCGTGRLAGALRPDAYTRYVGIDVSEEGLKQARERQIPRATFVQGDIEAFSTEETFDLIVFEETLYYVNPLKRRRVLRRYAQMLRPQGVLLITIHDPRRFRGTVKMIEDECDVLEHGSFPDSERCFHVCRRGP